MQPKLESTTIQASLELPCVQPQMRFHHIGFVVKAIERSVADFTVSLMADWDGTIVVDPLQAVRVTFLHMRRMGMPSVELVEPLHARSPVSRFLAKGGGLHHLCYQVRSLDQQLEWRRANGEFIVQEPVPAVAFAQRRIAWVYTKQKLLLELLEA